MFTIQNLIHNQLTGAAGGETLEVYEPATGQVYASAPRSRSEDAQRAVASARSAFQDWQALTPEVRCDYLLRIAEGIEKCGDELAAAESRDNGKPLHLARSLDIPRAAQNFRFFATALLHASQEVHARPGFLNYTLGKPLGVGVCISPWNLPLYLLSWKIAPALAAGNCVVAKPSEVTPLTAHYLAEIVIEAGLPPGVLNLVHGLGAEIGQALCEHEQVAAISFTGSTRTGKSIALQAAGSFKKVSLEMGGKNAALIFADAYEHEATRQSLMETVLKSSFVNQGQVCLCTSRLLIEASVYEAFKADFVAAVKGLTVGDPQQESTDQGAVVSKEHQQKILGCLKKAREEGGVFLTGGNPVTLAGRCENGYFVEPTVIEGLGPETCTNTEEIFGPVVTLQPFDNETESVALANATDYGLAASLWTRDSGRIQRLSQQIEAGVLWVNTWMARDLRTPFGGLKNSGVGREGGWYATNFWTEPRNVCIAEL